MLIFRYVPLCSSWQIAAAKEIHKDLQQHKVPLGKVLCVSIKQLRCCASALLLNRAIFKKQKFIIIIYSFLSPFSPSLPPSLYLPSTFLPASFLTITPPSAISSVNSGTILLVTSSCCMWRKGVVCMTESNVSVQQ